MKVFQGFRVFENALQQKTKTQKCWKSTESFIIIKISIVNGYIYTITRPLYIPFFIFAANYIKKNRQNIIHILI